LDAKGGSGGQPEPFFFYTRFDVQTDIAAVQIRIRVNAGFLGGFDKRENTNVGAFAIITIFW
jgi:hypothetical protein